MKLRSKIKLYIISLGLAILLYLFVQHIRRTAPSCEQEDNGSETYPDLPWRGAQ